MAGASISFSKNRSSTNREESISVGSDLYVAGGVEYNGGSLHTRGLNIQNDGDTVYNITGNIVKEAGVSTVKESGNSTGYGLSLAKGMTDGNGIINPLKSAGTTVSVNVGRTISEAEGTYYTNNHDITKGNSHYNNTGDVVIRGVDVQTGSISGETGDVTVESLQDTYNAENRGYTVGVSLGVGKGMNRKSPQNVGVNLSSVTVGHTRTDVEQKITNNITEFRAGSGALEVKGTVKQVGSLIDGTC